MTAALKLVPHEPTDDMMDAALMALSKDGDQYDAWRAAWDRAGDGWQDISTVPPTAYDGQRVDLWLEPVPERQKLFANPRTKGRRVTDAWFNGSDGAGWTVYGAYNGRFRNEVATHWMPPPAPPEPKS